jgi:hypothetical protein
MLIRNKNVCFSVGCTLHNSRHGHPYAVGLIAFFLQLFKMALFITYCSRVVSAGLILGLICRERDGAEQGICSLPGIESCVLNHDRNVRLNDAGIVRCARNGRRML